MKPKESEKERLATLANTAREVICTEHLNLKRIMDELEKAASLGFETVMITLNTAVNVEDTQAAKRLETELASMGIFCAWKTDYVSPDHPSNPTGVLQLQSNLIVSIKS